MIHPIYLLLLLPLGILGCSALGVVAIILTQQTKKRLKSPLKGL
jgi:hypothetical protein